MSSRTTFGVLLQQHRAAAGLSQVELAARAGLSRRAISDLERGARLRPYPSTLRQLSEALDLSAEDRVILARAAAQRAVGSRVTASSTTNEPPSAVEDTLPPEFTSFIGREHERGEVNRLLSNTRLLTLVGSGGVGKTRLAVSVAREWLTGFSSAHTLIAFVDLAPLVEADLLPQAVAAQLGFKEQPGRSVLASLIDGLQARSGVLLLDNCEHLVEDCAKFVHKLLTGCSALRVLVTSREALALPGETVWRVPSLDVPESTVDVHQIAKFPAVQLFVERARATLPEFEFDARTAPCIAEICRRLDGIPLALELAAARVSMLSVQQIAERLEDALGLLVVGPRLAPARQTTVRATLDWSYGLLTEAEQVLFERVSVFAGGWTLEAAETVTGAEGVEPREVLTLLGRLVDTSMLLAERGPADRVRYRLLEPVRQYAAECFSARGPVDAFQHRHAAYFLELAQEIAPDFARPEIRAAQQRLQAEHANLRAARGWLLERGDVHGLQRLAGSLGRFWFFHGNLEEADTWLARALALPGGDRPTIGRAMCLFGLSMLLISRGEYADVEEVAHEAHALFHAFGNAVEEAYCLFILGTAGVRLGRYAEARANLEAGVAVSGAARDLGAESACLFRLAMLATDLGDHDEARRWAEAAMARATDIGQVVQIADAQLALGVVSMRVGDHRAAAKWLAMNLSTWRELGARWFMAETLVHLGKLAMEQGELGVARARLSEGLLLAQEVGDRFTNAVVFEGFVELAVLEGRPRLALQLTGAAEAVRERLHAPLAPVEQRRLERYRARAQRALGDRGAEAARTEGRTMGVPRAIEMALAAVATPTGRDGDPLTPREQTIARLVADGKTNRQIAQQLFIAEGTAERHVGNIMAKLEMNARTQIAAWAVTHGLAGGTIPTNV